jgi:hypothetical protein
MSWRRPWVSVDRPAGRQVDCCVRSDAQTVQERPRQEGPLSTPVLADHRDESICPRTINYPRETSVELDPSEADAQEQLFQLIARIEPMPQAEGAQLPSSNSVVTILFHATP